LYRSVTKRKSRLGSAALFLVIVASMLMAVPVLADFVPRENNPWIADVASLRDGAIIAACVLFIVNAVGNRTRRRSS